MQEKICGNCKWVRQIDGGKVKNYVCMNPVNDMLWDYFNASSGNVIRNIRLVTPTLYDSTCQNFDRIKAVS